MLDHAREIPRAKVAILGIVTIAGYGAWFYAFGVLLDPIITDTGWSESGLAVVFSVSVVLGGLGSLGGGWLLDRFGSRTVFVVAAVAAAVAFQIAASADSLVGFGVAACIGGGSLGAFTFYHITQTAAVRISGPAGDRAIAVLTIWGAFSSAIYLPLAAFLVSNLDWRATLRILTLTAVVALLFAAATISTKNNDMPDSAKVYGDLRAAFSSSRARRFVVAQALSGIAVATVLVYQVPAMTAAGLTLAAASFWAGVRGFSQLLGRLPLIWIVDRLGIVGTLRLAYGTIAIGTLILAVAGTPLLALLFAVLAGFGIGASSPLVGMYSHEVFGSLSLGTAMGLVSLVFLVVGSIGPVAAGIIAEATGSRALPVALSASLVAVAALVIGGRSAELEAGEA